MAEASGSPEPERRDKHMRTSSKPKVAMFGVGGLLAAAGAVLALQMAGPAVSAPPNPKKLLQCPRSDSRVVSFTGNNSGLGAKEARSPEQVIADVAALEAGHFSQVSPARLKTVYSTGSHRDITLAAPDARVTAVFTFTDESGALALESFVRCNRIS
jgi:hypothetical protein